MIRTQPIFDRIAIATSTICAIHCAIFPIIVSAFPALFSVMLDDHYFHILLIWAVVPASVIALFMGCKKHKDSTTLIAGVSGVLILVLIAFFGHDFLGEIGEKIGTVIASFIIVFAHLRNHSLCHKSGCKH